MKNQIRTLFLLGALSALLVAVGGLIGDAAMYAMLVLALVVNVGAYFFSDRLVLRMHRARELSAHEHPGLHGMVEEMAQRAGIPKPRLFLVPEGQPNAFATGRNPSHGALAVTAGLLRAMGPRELRGVIAHEIAHIKNRDILVASVAAVLATAIGWLGNLLAFSGLFGRSDDEEGSAAGSLATVILAPIAATLLQLAVSRSREYLADETAARLTGDGEGLARALETLDALSRRTPAALHPATASLFIVNPLTAGERLASLFSTHPPIPSRVRRLRGRLGAVSRRPGELLRGAQPHGV